MELEQIRDVAEIAANVAVAAGAVFAVIKFKLLDLLGRRWEACIECRHYSRQDGTILLQADYIFRNEGPRQIQLNDVILTVHPVVVNQAGLVFADEDSVLAKRDFADSEYQSLRTLASGERSIFPIRCVLKGAREDVFIKADVDIKARRAAAAYHSLYVLNGRSRLEMKD